jgi:transposase-like protein
MLGLAKSRPIQELACCHRQDGARPACRWPEGRVAGRHDDAKLSQLRRASLPAEIISYAIWLYFRYPLSLRNVNQNGIVLDTLPQSRPNAQAAKHLLRKLLKKQMHAPRVVITDKLTSYGTNRREITPGMEHRQHKDINNRAGNSHQPTRRREQHMKLSGQA